jgi:hypothetical protein
MPRSHTPHHAHRRAGYVRRAQCGSDNAGALVRSNFAGRPAHAEAR